MNNIIGIIPCAGTASRLFSLPKFMLPMKDNNLSIMTNWINILFENKCNKIIIGTSDINYPFVNHIINTQTQHLSNIIIIKNIGITETMNETVLKCLENEIYDLSIMCMPDTYASRLSYDFIDSILNGDADVGVYLWNIRNTQLGKIGQCECDFTNNTIINIVDKDINCNYKYGWGVIIFKKSFENFILKEELHTGYSMKQFILNNNKINFHIMDGMFFDCGTIQGYTEYLNYMVEQKPVYIKGTIIILSVYINNDENNYDTLVKCLIQLRHIYKKHTIIAVDNDSLNNKWYEVAKECNIIILQNNSVLHRYEMGAYKFALQYFRADKYIFMQGTIYVYNKIDLSVLNIDKPNALAFLVYPGPAWGEAGINFINKLLEAIDYNKYLGEGLVACNSFCCNDLFLIDMLNDGLFDLPSNTKNHSCAFERVLGVYFTKKLGNIISLPSNYLKKYI